MKIISNYSKNAFFVFFTLLAITCWACYIYSIAPGFLSVDSFIQLTQALSGEYKDWHPPLMAFIWKSLIDNTGAISSMLLLQNSFLILSLFFVTYFYLQKKVSAFFSSLIIFPIFLLSPLFIGVSGAIWKDVLFAYSLLFATSLALNINSNNKKYILFLIVLILIYISLNIRINGFFLF